jgi:tRNA(Glu) U13 pseudouridine synthase TruD
MKSFNTIIQEEQTKLGIDKANFTSERTSQLLDTAHRNAVAKFSKSLKEMFPEASQSTLYKVYIDTAYSISGSDAHQRIIATMRSKFSKSS